MADPLFHVKCPMQLPFGRIMLAANLAQYTDSRMRGNELRGNDTQPFPGFACPALEFCKLFHLTCKTVRTSTLDSKPAP